MAAGQFEGLDAKGIEAEFANLTARPGLMFCVYGNRCNPVFCNLQHGASERSGEDHKGDDDPAACSDDYF